MTIIIMAIELKVGSKGELFLTKKIRKIMNIHPGDKIIVEMLDNSMVIRKIDDLVNLFMEEPLTQPQKPDEIENEIEKMQNEQISKMLKE